MISQEDIPNHWNIKRVTQVGDVITGGTPDTEVDEYWGGEIPWLRVSDIDDDLFITDSEDKITEEGLEKGSCSLLKEGSVVIATRATIGEVAIAGRELATNQGFKSIEPNDSINNKFLAYYLISSSDYLKSLGKGATFDEVNKTQIENLSVPVPPLDEQKHIVEAVEKRLSQLDRLEKSVQIIDKLASEYEKSLLSFLTVGRDVTEKSSVEGIPEKKNLPAGWDVVQLSEVTNVNPRVSYDESEDYAYVPMDAVGADEKAITRYERRESLYSGLAKFCEGDIIVARITPCFENGKMAVASNLPDGYEFAVGSTEFVVIRPTEIDPEYLFSYLKSPIVRQWGKHRLLGATGRERIKVSQFRSELTVPVPPQETQSQIAKNIKKNEFSKIRTSVNTVQDMFREYESSVLAHATKGNIET